MGFFALSLIYGLEFLSPVDRAGFPMSYETVYQTSTTLSDERWHWDLIGNDRMVITVVHLREGVQTDSSTFAEYSLNADGTIRGRCRESGCDYRQDGREYLYSGGKATRMRRWKDGKVEDSVDFAYQNGRLTGISPGITIDWSDGEIASVKVSNDDFAYGAEYTYSKARDTVKVQMLDYEMKPTEERRVFVLQGGRPISATVHDPADGVSRRTYRYGITTALRPAAPRRDLVRGRPFDLLGREAAGPKAGHRYLVRYLSAPSR